MENKEHFKFSDLGITDYTIIDSIKEDCDPESKVNITYDDMTSLTSVGQVPNITEHGFTLSGEEKDIESLIACIKEQLDS